MRSAMTVLTRAMAEPTLRSRSPAMITKVRPAAARARGAAFTKMFVMLEVVKKLGERKLRTIHKIATVSSRRSDSQWPRSHLTADGLVEVMALSVVEVLASVSGLLIIVMRTPSVLRRCQDRRAHLS